MKCCVSPTTSIAVSPAPSAVRSTAQRVAGPDPSAVAALQAVIFSEVLKPLAQALGPVGDVTLSSVSAQLFMRTRP
jgi:hypothetical protein